MAVAELSAANAVEIVPAFRLSAADATDERFLVPELAGAHRAAELWRWIIRRAGFESQVGLRQGSSTE
jgi:hypothetical protein